MAVCSWCLCCGKVSTLITRKIHFLNVSSKDRLHLPISPPTPSQSSCHAVLSDTPAGAYNSSMFREYFLITFLPGSRSSSVRRSLGALPKHLSKHLDPLYHCHFPSFLCHHQARPNQVSESQIIRIRFLFRYVIDIFFRYLFGLPPPRDSMIPGKACRGFLPCFILAAITVLLWSSLNIYRAYAY